MKAAYLKTGDTIIVDGVRLTVRDVKPTHKDGVCIRFRGRDPLYRRWDDEIEIVERATGVP